MWVGSPSSLNIPCSAGEENPVKSPVPAEKKESPETLQKNTAKVQRWFGTIFSAGLSALFLLFRCMHEDHLNARI